jgi:hypothetical protein
MKVASTVRRGAVGKVPSFGWQLAGRLPYWQGNDKTRRLKSKSSGLVLDVGDGGAIIQRKADDKAKGQLWRVVEAKE